MSWLSKAFKEVERGVKKIGREIDRALDKNVGIDDPALRAVAGAGLGALVGGPVGGLAAMGGGAAATGIATGAVTGMGLGAGAVGGAVLAGQGLRKSSVLGLSLPQLVGPTDAEVLAADQRLRRRMAQGARGSTLLSGGRSGVPARLTMPTLIGV